MYRIRRNAFQFKMRIHIHPAFLLLFLVCICAGTGAAWAKEEFRPALIFETNTGLGGDYAFIDSMKLGAQKAKEELGIQYEEFPIPEGKNRLAFFREVASSGVTHIIAVGIQNVNPVIRIANEFKEVKFTVIDGMVPPFYSNVQSVVFKDHEGAFLVGMIAGLRSPTNKIGFIGGIDMPIINNLALGYYQGARHVRPDIEMVRDTVATGSKNVTISGAANPWNNPERAKMLAKKQYNSDVGVIFAAAGGSSVGVLEAGEEMGKLAIGVDTNQNGLFPGTVLTSMVKRVDKVVNESLVNAYSGRWEPGIKYLGIRENALDYAVDVNNKDLITKKVIEKVEDAKERIIRGLIKIEEYEPY